MTTPCRRLLVSLLAVITVAGGCGYDGPMMTVEELAAAIEDPEKEIAVFDVRPRSQYGKGHVRGARNLPLAELKNKTAELKAIDGEIAVICNCGRNALAAAKQLADSGVSVILVEGGYKKWSAAGFPLDKN